MGHRSPYSWAGVIYDPAFSWMIVLPSVFTKSLLVYNTVDTLRKDNLSIFNFDPVLS